MSFYMKNDDWKRGISNIKWTDDDFLIDMNNYFDNIGKDNWLERLIENKKN